MIKVSIIITCHNLEHYIVRAINSCINQDFPHDQYEIIIIDDASTDDSRGAIALYTGFSGYHFIRTKFLKKNKGTAHASNVGIAMARGKYVVRVDGDDYIHKDFVKVMSEVLEWNPSIGMVHCDLVIVQGTGGPNQRTFQLNTFERLLDHGAGVMFRTSKIRALGGYNEQYRNCEDYDLLLRYNKHHKRYHLRLPYYRYFKRKKSLSTRRKERKTMKKRIREMLADNNRTDA